MNDHPLVNLPASIEPPRKSGVMGRFNEWLTESLARTLGSMTLVYLCLTVPLIAIRLNADLKLVITIIFSTWFQGWSLPVIQRSQNKIAYRQQAKAEVDHTALTHIANVIDDIAEHLEIAEPTQLEPISNPNYKKPVWRVDI
jgi:hypothetical protein